MTDFELQLLSNAKKIHKTIVLPEAGYSQNVYDAGMAIAKDGIADIIFLIKSTSDLDRFGFKPTTGIKVINIFTSELRPQLADMLFEKRKEKGLTLPQAHELLNQEGYFGTMLVEAGYAHGMVNGAETTTANSLRPALQIIKGKTPGHLVSSFFVMIGSNPEWGDHGILVLADCGLNENPNEAQLEQIVYDTVSSARQLTNIIPKVSLLSFSTKGSAEGETPLKMRRVAQAIQAKNPDFIVDGEMQLDASIVPAVCAKKAPNSPLHGDANILIFPDLTSGNIGYKLMQRFGNFTAIGPICQGFNKPVNDVSRGANSQEIALAIAITCLQK